MISAVIRSKARQRREYPDSMSQLKSRNRIKEKSPENLDFRKRVLEMMIARNPIIMVVVQARNQNRKNCRIVSTGIST